MKNVPALVPVSALSYICVLVAVNRFALHPGSHDIVKWCIFLFYENKLIGCECLILIPRNVETVHVYISRIIKAVQVYTRTMFLPICENVVMGTQS